MSQMIVAFAQACEMAHRNQKQQCTSKSTVTWHAMLVRPGSPDQTVHVDDARFRVGKSHFLFLCRLRISSREKQRLLPSALE